MPLIIQLNYTEPLYQAIIPRNPFKIKRRLADRLFSIIIRKRDNYTCVRCGHLHAPNSKGLHTSHYFSRSREATRFNYDNVDTLCLACHLLWSKNWTANPRLSYMAFKIKQLGKEKYKALAKEAKRPNIEFLAVDEKKRIKKFRNILGNAKLLYYHHHKNCLG